MDSVKSCSIRAVKWHVHMVQYLQLSTVMAIALVYKLVYKLHSEALNTRFLGFQVTYLLPKSMLFSSEIRTASTWMKSRLTARFDAKKSNVNELPSFESCCSPELWGLLVFLNLEIVPRQDPWPKKLFTVVYPQAVFASLQADSKACTCVSFSSLDNA